MTAKFIQMHKIIERTTLKIFPKEDYSLEEIVKRMYDCYAQVEKIDGKNVIKDIELGVLAEVIDYKEDPGQWHKIEPVVFAKANFEVESFFDEKILIKK